LGDGIKEAKMGNGFSKQEKIGYVLLGCGTSLISILVSHFTGLDKQSWPVLVAASLALGLLLGAVYIAVRLFLRKQSSG
jgi:hypothetical protein